MDKELKPIEAMLEKFSMEELEDVIRSGREFRKIMSYYKCAMMEIETKLKVLNENMSLQHDRNPIESIKTRLKTPESIIEKMIRRKIPFDPKALEEQMFDIAGVRVICSFLKDVYFLEEHLLRQDDVVLVERKDYIEGPKANGYRSLHLIVSIPIFLAGETRLMNVEIQLRTIAMDFWASLEHKIHYKFEGNAPEHIKKELVECAMMVSDLDARMLSLNEEVQELIARQKEEAAQTEAVKTEESVI